jgi:hypothetical protein
VVVCDVVLPEFVLDDVAEVFDDVPVALVVADPEVEALVPDVVAVVVLVLVLAAAVWPVVALWSRQARTPPRETIAATLSAAAALRALAARGLRLPRGRGGTRGAVVGEGVCSSMSTNVRIARE